MQCVFNDKIIVGRNYLLRNIITRLNIMLRSIILYSYSWLLWKYTVALRVLDLSIRCRYNQTEPEGNISQTSNNSFSLLTDCYNITTVYYSWFVTVHKNTNNTIYRGKKGL